MTREKILHHVMEWGNSGEINPYIYDALTDGSSYAEGFMQQLQPAVDADDLLQLVKVVMR